jgi:hypothetical protein
MRFNSAGSFREGMTGAPAKTEAESERGGSAYSSSRLQEINYAKMQQVSRKFEYLKEL